MKGNCIKFSALVLLVCLLSGSLAFGGLFSKKNRKSGNPSDAQRVESQKAPAAPSAPAAPATPAAPPSKARIQFDVNSHDFGDVAPDSQNNCKFKFKNVGTETLKIDHMQGTCKCTVPDLAKKEYQPGESGEISVDFHAPKFQGDTSQHVIVFSNDSEKPRAELEIKAHVKLAVQVTPETLNLSIVDANAGAVPVTIQSMDNEAFAITKIEATGNVVSFKFDPNNISTKHVLQPIINTTYLRNNLIGAVNFTINHPKCKEVRLQWTCLREFEASPSVIILRNAEVGEVQKRSIFLTSNYNQPIEIESVTSDKGIVKVTNQVKTENRYQFDVDITPPAKEGQLRVFSDTLHIKIKGKEEIQIPCRGFYKIGQ